MPSDPTEKLIADLDQKRARCGGNENPSEYMLVSAPQYDALRAALREKREHDEPLIAALGNDLDAAQSRVAELEAAGAEYVEDTDALLAEHRAKFGAFERRVAELDAGRLELLKRLDERLGDTEELAYALMSEAIARGTARWREKTGRTDVLPDTAALTSWLLDDMQKTERRVAELERLILKVEECLRGHLIGINCHGPKLDERTQVAWHAALTAAQKPGEEGGG